MIKTIVFIMILLLKFIKNIDNLGGGVLYN